MQNDVVSLIVPVWNHWEDLTKPFVESIMANTKDVNFELIIVDNGSIDQTELYLKGAKKLYSNLKVIKVGKNLGFGGGNNVGFKKAKGKYVCFISNDVLPTNPIWLKRLVDYCREKPALYGKEYIDYNSLTEIDFIPTPYITGYLMFGEKKMFKEAMEDNEVFDTGFGTAYYEDVDLSIRCKEKGYELIAINDLPVIHLGSKSSDQINISKQTILARRHFTNKMMWKSLEKNKKKRIVFFSRSTYGFLDGDYEGRGVGGAEASFIQLARVFAKKGWVVDVYNTTKLSGKFNGVNYHNITKFDFWDYCDIFVLFRSPETILPYVNAVKKIFWSCDQYTQGNWQKEVFPYVDKIVGISPYHVKYLNMVYGPLYDKIISIDLGIKVEDYKDPIEKVPGKIIFCSVPHRGLGYLYDLFSSIKSRVPHASLYITSDYTLWGLGWPDNEKYVEKFKDMRDVYFLGKVPRKDLVYHQMTAEVMAYPCDYEECFCIASMECIASGAIPVTTKLAALETTVGDSGILLSNLPKDEFYDTKFVDSVVDILKNKDKADILRKYGRERALTKYSWDAIYEKWMAIINDLEKGDSKMVVCKICHKNLVNSYVLSRHIVKKHGDTFTVDGDVIRSIEDAPSMAESGKPGEQLLRFKQAVECQINGRKFEGKQFSVPYEMVGSIIGTLQTAYGKDILDI